MTMKSQPCVPQVQIFIRDRVVYNYYWHVSQFSRAHSSRAAHYTLHTCSHLMWLSSHHQELLSHHHVMSWKMQQEATESIYSKNLTNRSKYLLLLQFLCLCMIWWCMCVSVLLHLSCVDSLICMLKISAHACTQTLVTFNILLGSRQFFFTKYSTF